MNQLPDNRSLPLILRSALPLLLVCMLQLNAAAQSKKNPSEYMGYIGSKYNELSVQFYRYMSTIAHSKNARKIEKQRSELLTLSWDTYTDVRTMPIFRGNRALRDSAAAFLKVNHRILKEDYDKILNMEEIAERSYNDMEAYITAQREARNKLDIANIRMLAEQKKFAVKYNLTLVERTDELFLRMRQTNDVLTYLNQVYLTFFKCHKDEIYLMESMSGKELEQISTYRARLSNSVRAGFEFLDAHKSYNGDASLAKACKDLLRFYNEEAAGGTNVMVEYALAEIEFDQARKKYISLSEEERTPEAVAQYNEEVRNMNKASDRYNEINRHLNAERLRLITQWRIAYDRFLENHIPKF